MSRTLPALLFALLAACVDGDELAATTAPTCGGVYPFIHSMSLPPMKLAAKPAPQAPTLEVDPTFMALDGDRIGDAELGERLGESRERLRKIAAYGRKVDTDRILLAADATLPVANVVAVLAAIHAAGFAEVLVLGAPSSTPSLPPLPKPELGAQLRSETDASVRAMRAAQAIENAIWLCPDLTAIFSAIAAADPSVKCKLVVAGFREMSSLCIGDQDAIATVLLLMSEPQQYTTFRELRLAPEQPMAAGETWGELIRALPDEATRLGLQPTG